MIDIPPSLITGIIANAYNLGVDLKPLILLGVGVFLGAYILNFMADMFYDWREGRAILKRRAEELEEGLESEVLRPVFGRYHKYRVEEKRKELFEEA
jgi:hypothetical protein